MVLSYVTCLIHFSVFLRKRGNASTDQFFASMVPLNEPSKIFLVRCSPKTNYSLKHQYVGVSQVLQRKTSPSKRYIYFKGNYWLNALQIYE